MVGGIGNCGGMMNTHSMQQRGQKMFNKIDSNADGGIDQTEFGSIAEKFSAKTGSSINTGEVFAEYDSDSDGSLSKDEIKGFMKDNAPQPPFGMQQAMMNRFDPSQIFSKIDSNGDGGVDQAELDDLAERISKKSGSTLNTEEAFSTYDTDSDGVLNEEEMKSFMKDNAPGPSYEMRNAMQSYGMNMGKEQISSLLNAMNGQEDEDRSGSSSYNSGFNDQMSTLLDMLNDRFSSADSYSQVALRT